MIDKNALREELEPIMDRVIENYKVRPYMPLQEDSTTETPPDVPDRVKLYIKTPIESLPNGMCRIQEVAGISSLIDRQRKQWAFWLSLYQEDVLCLDMFLLHRNTGTWDFSHRLVPMPFRGQGLFHVGREVMETFIEGRGRMLQQAQVITVNAGQRDVLRAFYHAGYKPQNEAELGKLERVLSADPDLVSMPAVRPNPFVAGEQLQVIPEEHTSLYLFEREAIQARVLHIGDAFRVQLAKHFPLR